jgi:hypothetical protein
MKRLEFSLCWLGWSWCCRLIPWNPRSSRLGLAVWIIAGNQTLLFQSLAPDLFLPPHCLLKGGITSQSIVAMLLRFYVIFFFI